MDSKFDFIIVGGGPAGCALAAHLCGTAIKPNVLLIEAGGENEDISLRVDGKRWSNLHNVKLNLGYKTTPQEKVLNRVIDYSRGSGLGGSSIINFGMHTIGAQDDFEEWARVTGNDTFNWKQMQRRFKSLETFDGRLPPTMSATYASPSPANHGDSGPLRVGYPAEWERELPELIRAIEKAGVPFNPDHNSGNPLGISALISSAHAGLRSIATDLITPKPSHLTILTKSPVQRVVFKDNRAVGVEANGKIYFCSKEVILCAGALDSPKILMHSGIGDPHELEKFGISVISSLSSVGKGLRDHPLVTVTFKRVEGSTDRPAFYANDQAMEDAQKQWDHDRTGPWSKFACEAGIGWFKLGKLASIPEFGEIPEDSQQFLLQETVPHYELTTSFPLNLRVPNFPFTALDYTCLVVMLCQTQSRGEVTLQSADPSVPLLFNPKVFGMGIDRRMAILALREVLRLTQSDFFAKDHPSQLIGPKSDSDEDLWAYWQERVAFSWHMTGTVKMGQEGEEDAAVDSRFRLLGNVAGLRVADMSVVPILPSAHTQSVAYVTGMACGETLAEEYQLN